MIGVRSVGKRQKRVRLEQPGARVPDGDGGYTQGTAPLNPPAMFAHIRPATQVDLERIVAGASVTTATHVVEMPYHQQVTTATQVIVEDYPAPERTFEVAYVGNPDERDADMVLLCTEVLHGAV